MREEGEEQDGQFFLILSDFERKWRLGTMVDWEEQGEGRQWSFLGVGFGSEKTPFSHISM